MAVVTWPVFDPGAGGLADLYPYEVEIDQPVEIDVDFHADEETTEPMPSAWLVERCTTAAALR
jgi:hypothetical protein